MRRLAVLSALLVLVASSVFAAPPDYMTLKLGAYSPQDGKIEAVSTDMSTGFNGEWAIGHYFHPNMAMEFSIGYMESRGKGTLNGNAVSVKISAVPVLLNIKGVIPFSRGEIYTLAGGGFYVADGRGSSQGVTAEDSDTTFGWQVGIGGNYNLSETVFLGLEGKYLWVKPTFDIPGVIPGVASLGVHLDGIQATANIGYRW
jgi:outer membrane protein W